MLEPLTGLLAKILLPAVSRDRRTVRRLESVLARTIAERIDRLDDKGAFLPTGYTELTAAHVIERVHLFQFWRRLPRPGSGRRRLVPLARGLRRRQYRILHLEGLPGSGKSVALRHVTRTMALKAGRPHLRAATLPVYVNLRDAVTPESSLFDAATIRALALRAINPMQSPALLTKYLDEHFDDRLLRGKWMFLVDSFDELPAILAAGDADPVIEHVTAQLRQFFLAGDNTCRAVIASRPYRAPKEVAWHRLTIAPLNDRQQRQIVRSTVHPEYKGATLEGIATADADLIESSRTPLFLTLLW